MSDTDKKPRYFVVQRRGWHEYEGVFSWRDDDTGMPVRVFATKKAAKRFCQQQTRADRRHLSPFRFEHGEIDCLSSLETDEAMGDAVRKLGLEPPAGVQEDTYIEFLWQTWWDANAGDWTPEQRDAIWDLCDKLEFYIITPKAMSVED